MVLTVTGLDAAGLHGVDETGTNVTVPTGFVEGRRTDGSPNCFHAWARTVDGVQGGTWTQVHLLGSAALERFTGYVGQSRSRQPTHTWNVASLPTIDHGGILADQRDAAQAVLESLQRVPDRGFAIHHLPPNVRLAAFAQRTQAGRRWPAMDRLLPNERAGRSSLLAPGPPRTRDQPDLAIEL